MPTPQSLSTIVLPQSYGLCRDIMTSHGRTYSLATRPLAPRQQCAMWSLYAQARIVNGYVDCPVDADRSPTHIKATVTQLSELFHSAVVSGSLDDVHRDRDRAVISAAAKTFRDYDIDPQLSADFAHSMLTDVPGTSCHVAHFETWGQLDSCMQGSAAVIDLEMIPILGTRTGVSQEEATPYAECLGKTFQVTDFLRNITEDFHRGRIYLPLNEQEAFGVGTEEIGYYAAMGRTTPAICQTLAYFIAHNRALYAEATSGIGMLEVSGCQAIHVAEILYSDILGEIERMSYSVFMQRAQVGRTREAKIAFLLLSRVVVGRLRRELPEAQDTGVERRPSLRNAIACARRIALHARWPCRASAGRPDRDSSSINNHSSVSSRIQPPLTSNASAPGTRRATSSSSKKRAGIYIMPSQ